jgi:hypothetical protein
MTVYAGFAHLNEISNGTEQRRVIRIHVHGAVIHTAFT